MDSQRWWRASWCLRPMRRWRSGALPWARVRRSPRRGCGGMAARERPTTSTARWCCCPSPRGIDSMCAERILASTLVLALAGCTCQGKPDAAPSVSAVVPARGFETDPIAVEIHGASFAAKPTLHFGGGDPLTADARYQAWLGDIPLLDVAWVDASTLTATVPGGAAPGLYRARVRDPYGREIESDGEVYEVVKRQGARLEATLEVARTRVQVGETIASTLIVTNSGDTAATVVAPSLRVDSGPAAVETVPLPVDIGPGEAKSFGLEVHTQGVGTVLFSAAAQGRDAYFGGVVSVAPISAAVEVATPPVLSATAAVTPATASTGQQIAVDVVVTNTPAFPVVALSLDAIASGTGAAEILSRPVAKDLAGGESRTFRFTFSALTPGEVRFEISGRATDPSNGLPVDVAPVSAGPMTIVKAAALSAPPPPSKTTVSVGETFTAFLD